jgi:uncharacterized protein (DUF433 family)
MMKKFISTDHEIRSGEPCLKGTRLTVTDVISIFFQQEEGDYDLNKEQIDACLIYYFTCSINFDVEQF